MEEKEESEEYKEFMFNIVMIKALIQFLSDHERKNMKGWLKKLCDIEDGGVESKCRNEYSHHLLLTLQNGTLSAPFDRLPPGGKLKPLCKILPDYVYEEMVRQIKANREKVKNFVNVNNESFEMPDLRCEPAVFQGQHPRPLNGVTAMCAAFSNYDEDAKQS